MGGSPLRETRPGGHAVHRFLHQRPHHLFEHGRGILQIRVHQGHVVAAGPAPSPAYMAASLPKLREKER